MRRLPSGCLVTLGAVIGGLPSAGSAGTSGAGPGAAALARASVVEGSGACCARKARMSGRIFASCYLPEVCRSTAAVPRNAVACAQ